MVEVVAKGLALEVVDASAEGVWYDELVWVAVVGGTVEVEATCQWHHPADVRVPASMEKASDLANSWVSLVVFTNVMV